VQHLTSHQLKDYGKGALTPAALLAADDHLAGCGECRRRIAPVAVSSGAFRALQEGFLRAPEGPTAHLQYTQMAALLDDGLDETEREIVSSHLEGCVSCKNELRELSAFRVELASAEPPEMALPPPATPARITADATPANAKETPESLAQIGYDTRPRSWWKRLKNKFTSSTDWTWLEGAILSAVVLALIFGLFRYANRAEQGRRLHLNETTLNAPLTMAPPPVVSVPADTNNAAISPNAPASGAAPRPYNGGPGNIYTPPSLPPQPNSAYPSAGNPRPANSSEVQYVAQLRDGGGSIGLDRQGQLYGADALSGDLREAVKNALARQSVDIAATPAELSGRAGGSLSGRGEGLPFGLNGPLRVISRSDRPSFHWQPLKGASGYVVTVFDQNFSAVATSGKLSGTSWQPPSPLPRGQVYMWQVAATRDGEEIISPTSPAPEARFKVLEAEHLQNIEQAGKARSRLALGLACARAGLLREARQEFGALVRANPDSPVARKLLEKVQQAGG
jgi:anti-sigma factor RsiW